MPLAVSRPHMTMHFLLSSPNLPLPLISARASFLFLLSNFLAASRALHCRTASAKILSTFVPFLAEAS